ncbi:transporter [Xanthomonas hortorum pv. gardneri]|nr:autotransporter outer membrane beta-barrel domain-containing protein [Xanthomonas hortorum pv. gardneri]EGD20697.1 outer membrane autotransporter barrel domain-containing protein [Xanthomonas hortorum ATCC 19865]KLA98995.1 transporter [Xanthomonas hortorum pv. gardneri]KLB00799.1 transporter [Xanthomonas hortorum pv. gardneri]KLB04976.1 transporter [Xanthomonas hortorum pv. gardneri]
MINIQWSFMNRIYRLVLNRATGSMQVASELATSHGSSARATGSVSHRSPLTTAMLVALGLLAAPSAFAAVFDFNSDDTITSSRVYADGFRVGPNGTVVVDVSGTAVVTSDEDVSLGSTAAGNGTLRLTGPGARLAINSGFWDLLVGDAGIGNMTLQGGSQATTAGLMTLGNQQGSTGNVLVTGAGSALTARNIRVGRGGTGTMEITNGGTVTTTRPYSVVNDYGMSLGDGTNGAGTVNISNGGTLAITDNFLLVGMVRDGTLNIGNGGTVNADRGVHLGGTLISLSNNGTSNGTVNVADGGELNTAELILGVHSDSSGVVTVTGTGRINADTVSVGSNGDGSLTLSGGAVLLATTDVLAERPNGISDNFGQTGRIVVSGAGSAIEAPRVDVSNELLVEGGAAIRSTTATIKDSYANTRTNATLTGAGSNWTNSGAMRAFTNFEVLGGAVVSTDTLNISGGLNSSTFAPRLEHDQVRVSGAGSAIVAANGVTVGGTVFEPYGVLSASSGGRIDGGSGITLGTAGYLVLGGGMDQWSLVTTAPTWRAAEAAGELSASPILMQANSGGLVFNHTGDATLSNTISSVPSGNSWVSGQLLQLFGNTRLDGNLTAFGGEINVTGGTLEINSDLYTGQGYTDPGEAFPQEILVSGGTLVLNGTSGFQQQVTLGNTVETIRSSTAVITGEGILAGNARLGSTALGNGGTLSPGRNGVGTMAFDGDLYFAANNGLGAAITGTSFYDVDVLGNGQSDRLVVAGRAYFGRTSGLTNIADAALRVTALDPAVSYQNGQTYTIVEAAGGVVGRFDQVTSRSAFLDPSVTYTDNQVQLSIAVRDTPPPVTPVDPVTPVTPVDPVAPVTPVAPITPVAPPLVFGAVAVSSNQRATAAALNTLQQSGAALALYNGLLMMDADTARAAFDDLSGEIHASNRALLLEDRFLREGINQRLRQNRTIAEDGGASAWVSGGGASNRQDGDGSAARANQHREGLMAGVDWSFGERWTVGLAAGSESLRQQIHARNASSDVDAVHAGVYASFRGDAAWITGGASYADYQVDTERTVGMGSSIAQGLNSRYDADAVSAFAEGGWDFELDALTLTPYVALAYTRLSTDAGVENGGNAALAIDASKDEVWTTTAGVRAAWDISGRQQDGARLEAGLAWQNAGGELHADSRHRFVAGSNTFTVDGVPLARNVGIAELGVSINTSSNSRLALFGQGRAGGGQREVGAQLNWTFAF